MVLDVVVVVVMVFSLALKTSMVSCAMSRAFIAFFQMVLLVASTYSTAYGMILGSPNNEQLDAR